MPNKVRLVELLDRWNQAREKGQQLAPHELCPDDPELAAELAERIKFLLTVDQRSHTDQSAATVRGSADEPLDDSVLLLHNVFENIRLHAKGGLGIVCVANDSQLHRDVAVKFMKERPEGQDEARLELIREAEVTGKLEHPGVVPVYGLGQRADGQPFYVMRFIRGESMESAIARFHRPAPGEKDDEAARNLNFRNLLSRFTAVCNTVAYAHNRGIIHRDIKPDNIMLGKYGETLLVDWGLAIPVDRDEQARKSGEKTLMLRSPSQSGNSSGCPIGTPAYMSPEQAAASDALTPATDVYSLGATLYKILTGDSPGKGKDIHEVCQRVRNGLFTPPSKVRDNVPRGLEAITLKAMALRPEDRYAGPLELAKDVDRWLADEPVTVLHESRLSRGARWMRRHRGVAAFAALGLVAALVLAVFTALWMGGVARREHEAREASLVFAAKFAARSMATEMDLRWRILEREADDPRLIELITQVNEMPKDEARWAPLQAWLNQKFLDHQEAVKSSAWFIDDRIGTLVAISSSSMGQDVMRKYLGQSYAYRDYFHGRGEELDPQTTPGPIEPLTEPYRSAVFRSTIDHKLKVAFSVPIRKSRGGDVLGVLAMTVDIGSFEILQTQLGPNQLAVLVDTRPDKENKSGLILHHRRLAEMDPEKAADYRIEPELLDRLLKLRAARLRGPQGAKPDAAAMLDAIYIDPVGGPDAHGWSAAYEPVFVPGRSTKSRDTGWVVIVQGKR
jgi:serine/threonine protein kinase